jgi:hypothetical protein
MVVGIAIREIVGHYFRMHARTNSKGHIIVFNRGNTTGPAYSATAAQLLEFDKASTSSR